RRVRRHRPRAQDRVRRQVVVQRAGVLRLGRVAGHGADPHRVRSRLLWRAPRRRRRDRGAGVRRRAHIPGADGAAPSNGGRSMTWAHPFVLVLAPVALIAAWWLVRRARGSDGPVFANIKRLWADRHGLSDRPVASRRRALGGVCLAAGAAAAVLALARPQWGELPAETFDQSREGMPAPDR